MGFFNIFRKSAPTWNDLSMRQKKIVTGKLMAVTKAMAGPRYQVVSGWDEFNREHGQIETRGEDEILTWASRGRMLDLARNQSRNSPTFNALLKQFDFNAIGTKGGKCSLMFENPQLMQLFSKYTRDCDFFDGMSFNSVLKLILRTYILGGDCVILFDDGLIEDSGKMVIYEPDEIGNTTDEALKARYGKFARQSLGKVYNGNSRWIGTIVSRACRGQEVFDPQKCYFLSRNPDESMFDSMWLMPRNCFRINQGRGVSMMSSSLANTVDLEDLCKYELQAAKKNSQILATVLQEAQPPLEQAELPSAFDESTDFESMSAEEIDEAIKAEQNQAQPTMTLDKVTAAGTIYQVLPEGYRMELLDTKRPNPNIPDFIKFLASRSAAPLGLSQMFATLAATGSDYRAESVMSWPAFQEAQKFLEQICDWTLYRFAKWAVKKGMLNDSFEEDWIKKVSWQWPQMQEADELNHQNAVEKKFANLTGSFRDEYGSDWREKLMQIKEEIDWCKANNIPHPSFAMKSGGERTGADSEIKEDNEDI